MGMKIFGSYSKSDLDFNTNKISDFDPDPSKFEIKKVHRQNNHLVVLIHYPNCINYEGNKIIVYKNTELNILSNALQIDPHFTEKDIELKPFARFEPTDDGWKAAIALVNIVE